MGFRIIISFSAFLIITSCVQKSPKIDQAKSITMASTKDIQPTDLKMIMMLVDKIDKEINSCVAETVSYSDGGDGTGIRYKNDKSVVKISCDEMYDALNESLQYYFKDNELVYIAKRRGQGVDCYSADSCPGGSEYEQLRLYISAGKIFHIEKRYQLCKDDSKCPPLDSLLFHDVTDSVDAKKLLQDETVSMNNIISHFENKQ